MAKLQELYMRDMDDSKNHNTVHENIQQQNLLQLATPELLAISQPAADFALSEHSRKMHIVPALHEIEALRRDRDSVKEQACSLPCQCSVQLQKRTLIVDLLTASCILAASDNIEHP